MPQPCSLGFLGGRRRVILQDLGASLPRSRTPELSSLPSDPPPQTLPLLSGVCGVEDSSPQPPPSDPAPSSPLQGHRTQHTLSKNLRGAAVHSRRGLWTGVHLIGCSLACVLMSALRLLTLGKDTKQRHCAPHRMTALSPNNEAHPVAGWSWCQPGLSITHLAYFALHLITVWWGDPARQHHYSVPIPSPPTILSRL